VWEIEKAFSLARVDRRDFKDEESFTKNSRLRIFPETNPHP